MQDSYKMSDNRFAKIVSTITHPPIISIPTFVILNYFLAASDKLLVSTSICLIFGAFLPILTSLILIKKMDTDLDITDRTKRTLPLLLAICSYFIGSLVLYLINAPSIITALMLIYGVNTLIILLINFYWKISIHAMGIAGPTAAFAFTFGVPGLLLGIIIPFVMWSRVKLNKHTVSQVIAGTVLGLFLTWAQLSFYVPLIQV